MMNRIALLRRSQTVNQAVMQFCVMTLLTLGLYIFLYPSSLSACAMSAVISAGRSTLNELAPKGITSEYTLYNDPWDYFGFVMANSNYYTNSDGYGVVAYSENDPLLTYDSMWYKRIYDYDDFGNAFYTGPYLDNEDQSGAFGYDVMDTAMQSIRSGAERSTIVMCHARSASGITYGNHPFTFHHGGRTYTFMHNGVANAARNYMIARIHEFDPDVNWFVQHPSNYFGETDPRNWVDTEVLFHYIMSYVISSEDNVLIGLQRALSGIRQYLENPASGVYNFIMSDGTRLYVYRSSPRTGTNSGYKLSYRSIDNTFYGIRTQTPQAGDTELRPRELVVFERGQEPMHYPEFFRNPIGMVSGDQPFTDSIYKPDELAQSVQISPNPFTSSTRMSLDIPASTTLKATIYNMRGEAVWHTRQEYKTPGRTTIIWNGTNDQGQRVASGVYVIKTEVGYDRHTGRIVFIK